MGLSTAHQRPVLFLDIDGVLHSCYAKYGQADFFAFFPMAALARICAETCCDIVLSSSWREFDGRVALVETQLANMGLGLCGRTPSHLFGGRANEIVAWMRRHRRDANCGWCALDDEHLPALGAHAVKVNPCVGLTDADATLAIARLRAGSCALPATPLSPLRRGAARLARALSASGLRRGRSGSGGASPRSRKARKSGAEDSPALGPQPDGASPRALDAAWGEGSCSCAASDASDDSMDGSRLSSDLHDSTYRAEPTEGGTADPVEAARRMLSYSPGEGGASSSLV